VGWQTGVTYNETSVEMVSGDLLLLYTDGLSEALAGHGNMSDEPLCRLLGTLAGKGPDEVADAIDAQIGGGELTDDAAYLVVRCA
jgi:serine phosphatase RsbU (regulator of sigma subunit)